MRFLLIILSGLLCLPACRQADKRQSGGMITVTDDLGHHVTLDHVPQRIVSLAPSITESLFALGLDSSVAGVTEYCDFPEAARRKPKVGGMLNPNVERVLALRPDLVLMSGSGNVRSDYEKLTSSGVTVFVSYPKSVEDVFKSISAIGTLTTHTDRADSIVHRLRQRRDELVQRALREQRKSVLMLLSLSPIIAIGPGTFLDELLSLANGVNIAHGASASYPALSREEILRSQPDVIIAMNDIARSEDDILRAYPEWEGLNAVRHKQVAIVDAAIVSRPGPRVIDGLDAVIRAIHTTR